MPLPLGFPGAEDPPDWLAGALYNTPTQGLDPNEIAAMRQRNAVRPPLGRQEGPATQFVEETFGLPHTPLDAAAMFAGGPFGRAGSKVAALALGGLLSSGGEAEAGPLAIVKKAIRAYHGSPHDFERFDLSKIGTGEGAQAYGHGLYFAENPTVAQQYRDTLAPSRGKLPDDIISLPPEMRQAIMAHAGTDADAVTAAKRAQYMSSALRSVDLPKVTDMVERARLAKQGRMYEVNINAAPEQFLDWDKPLSVQPQRERIIRAADKADLPIHENFASSISDPTGADLYHFLTPTGSLEAREASRYVPQLLNEAGIPGIKYLDQGSRAAGGQLAEISQFQTGSNAGKWKARSTTGEMAGPFNSQAEAQAFSDANFRQPTSNYVLFRDDIIDILRKYGLAGLAPAVGAAGMAGQEAPLPMSIPQSQ